MKRIIAINASPRKGSSPNIYPFGNRVSLLLFCILYIMNYVEYDESLHGKLTYPEGFIDLLKGIPIEEQMDFFRIGNGLYLKEEI